MSETRPPQGAQAALRAVRLLKLYTSERPQMSLAEISAASGLNKTTTHRLLRALQSESLIDRNAATSAYSLGAGTGNIGTRWPLHATSTGKAWIAFEQSGMDRIGDLLEALTASTLTSKESFQPQLADIRRRGYAVSVDELEDGFTAVATLIRGTLGEVQGALSIGGPTQRLGVATRAELGTPLCRAVARLTRGSDYLTV